MTEQSKNHVKKIAVLLPSLQVGGAERLVFEELSYLKKDPRFYFEIHLVFEPGYWYDKFRELGIPVHVWNAQHKAMSTTLTCFKIILYLRKRQFDVLHIHLLELFGVWLGIFAGVKTFQTVHYEIKKGMMKRISLRFNNVLFGCGAQVTNNLGNFIPARKIRLLNNAINPLQASTVPSEDVLLRLGLRKENQIVLTLGRLTRQKGYDVLIQSFIMVVRKQSKAVLLIGGDGPDMESFKRQIAEAGMQGHILLLGIVSDVTELLEICDVYVNSSRWEGLPITLLEAIAARKPIVATRVGGNAEVVREGETGLLVPPERADLLAEAILNVLGDKALRDKLGTQAYELFKNDYTIEKHCETLASAYLNGSF